MPSTNAERDIERAEGLRKLATRAKSVSAKNELNRAADRFEIRGAKKASRLGIRRRKRATPAFTVR